MTEIYETIVTMTSIMNRCNFDEMGKARCNRQPATEENKADEGDKR